MRNLGEQLLVFIMTGVIPFTDIVISPLGMMLFWILVVPATVILWRIISTLHWQSIDLLALLDQRRINRSIRLFIPPTTPSTVYLVAITLLILDDQQQPKTPAKAVAPTLRRLTPLPS